MQARQLLHSCKAGTTAKRLISSFLVNQHHKGIINNNCKNMSDVAMDDLLWSFGYGSNMDVKALEAKKHVQITEHCPAILRNYRMAFSLKALAWVEPAYANVEEREGEEVHGVAFCMSKDSVAELDRTEIGYNKKMVTLEAYDGRKIKGFIYVNKKEPEGEYAPSKRYLGVLCKGARQAGLKEEYIEKLSKTETYVPPNWLLELRKSRPDPSTLKEITVEELAQHKSGPNDIWISCLGYVVTRNWAMDAHKGRDITSRALMQFHGIPLDDNDDKGRPPYPLVKNITPDELDYITSWLDFYQASNSKDGKEGVGEILGYVKEFREQQESGETTFVLPDVPN